jgi:hypothetical protein
MYHYAQTFYIHSDTVRGADYVTVPRVDLLPTTYPKPFSKAAAGLPDPGITVAICEVNDRGIPDPDLVVSGSKHHMTRSALLAVRVSSWCNITMPQPVILKTNKTYALLIATDGGSDYRFGVHKRNLTSAQKKQNLPNPGFYVDGDLFQLADGVPKRLTGLDLNMRVYVARHTELQTTIQVVNDRHEFFTVNSHSAGIFNGDEIVYDANTENGELSTQDITFSYVSKAIAGNNTTFTSDFAPGDIIILTDAANTSEFESNTEVNIAFAEVVQVVDNELLLVANEPDFSANVGYYYVTPTARVYTDTPTSNQVILHESSAANDTFRFKAGSVLKGIDSGVQATVQSIDDWELSRITPEINAFIPSSTRVDFEIRTANASYAIQTAGTKAILDANTDIRNYRAIIASRSNEVANAAVRASLYQNETNADRGYKYKSVKADIVITSENEFCSPVLVEELTDFFVYTNDITSTANNVEESSGTSADSARYVSKVVTLADGLDAEDLRVYLTASVPSGSEVKVYAKVLNSYDNDTYEDKMWAELEIKKVASSTTLSPADSEGGVQQGLVEYEYGFQTRPSGREDHIVIGIAGTTDSSNTITIPVVGYTAGSLVEGDIICLTNGDNSDRPMVSAVVSVDESTGGLVTVGLADAVTDALLVGAGMIVTKVPGTLAQTPFTNTKNNNVVRYFDGGIKYDNYKSYGIKIVLLAGSPAQAPRVADYRAIAMSA